ncbi:MAG: RAMP superfamily CRISPR-associated protein, partial [Sphingomonadaceae bacterium]
MTRPFQRFPLVLTPLAPIHIGSGDDLDWTRAVLDPKRCELVLFDPLAVRLDPARAQKLGDLALQATRADDLISLQRELKAASKWLAGASSSRLHLTASMAKDLERAVGYNVQAGQSGAGTVANQLIIARHAIDPSSGSVYVPASSLKGAIRTAEIDERDRKRNTGDRNEPRPDPELDPSDDLLGRFQDSPFARVLLSDLRPTTPIAGLVAHVRNERRGFRGDRSDDGVTVRAELIPPFVAGAFCGDLRVHVSRGDRDRRQGPDIHALLRTAHAFHGQLFDFFKGQLEREQRGLPQGWAAGIVRMLGEEPLASALGQGRAALVRLGKFCSAESKTLAWRSVRIPQAQPPSPARVLNPYTLWLADLGMMGRLPLGWALLELGEEPCAAVQDFCTRFAPEAHEPAPPPPPEPESPASERIITDRSPPNRNRIGDLA